jgi:hypothetical protein
VADISVTLAGNLYSFRETGWLSLMMTFWRGADRFVTRRPARRLLTGGFTLSVRQPDAPGGLKKRSKASHF